MNKHILVAMDRKNKTKKELLDNLDDSIIHLNIDVDSDLAVCMSYYAYAAADASFDLAIADSNDNEADENVEELINKHFERTGENKQAYIDAINGSLTNSQAEDLLLEYIVHEYTGKGTTNRLSIKVMEFVSSNKGLKDLVNDGDWEGVKSYQFNKVG